jgi:hypothetical protein
MAYGSNINTSLYGRRFGLQQMTTNQTGTGLAGRQPEFLVGPEDIRKEVTTGDSTATYLKAYGISYLSTGLVTDATAIFRLDPPIPGVEKTIVWGSTTVGTMSAKIFVTISTGVGQFQTSGGSSFSCVASSAGAVLRIVGVTTSIYATVAGATLQGFSYTTTT